MELELLVPGGLCRRDSLRAAYMALGKTGTSAERRSRIVMKRDVAQMTGCDQMTARHDLPASDPTIVSRRLMLTVMRSCELTLELFEFVIQQVLLGVMSAPRQGGVEPRRH